jgi:ribosomal protein L7/L12
MSYNKVIPLLKEALDWKSICFQVAAEHPDVFLEAYTASYPDQVRNDVVKSLNGTAANKIKAMKVYREATGTGLQEAKDYVESIIKELNLN